MKSVKALRIKSWAANFTVSQSRREIKDPKWVPVRIQLDNARYRILTGKKDGEAHFGVFMALVEVAAGSILPGWLIGKDGRPLSPAHLAAKTGMRGSKIARAIAVLQAEDMGWLIEEEVPDIPRTLREHSENAPSKLGAHSEHARAPARPDQTRGDEIRQNQSEADAKAGSPPDSAAPPSGWLAGSDPAAMLAAIPIREPALSVIVAAGATCEGVKAVWLKVKGDQLRGNGIGSAEAVFINRICLSLGVRPPKRAAPTKAASVATMLTPDQIARFAVAKEHDRRTQSG